MKNVSKLLVFILCLTVIMASFALAANTQTYTLDELYMQVSIPTELAVFTRNIAVDDPNLAAIGSDKQSMEEYFNTNNIYLDALAMDASYELVIMMTNSDASQEGFNFNLYDDSELKELEAVLTDGYAKMGIDVSGYTSELTPELGAELQSVVDSVVFTQTLPTPEDNLKLKSTKFFSSLPAHAATRLIISGVAAFIVAAVFAIRHLKKKKKSAASSSSDNNNF